MEEKEKDKVQEAMDVLLDENSHCTSCELRLRILEMLDNIGIGRKKPRLTSQPISENTKIMIRKTYDLQM